MVSRRGFLIGLGGMAAASVAAGYVSLVNDPTGRVVITPPEVLDAVWRGEVLLVDIRRPDEWQSTGLADGAVPIDMRRPDFVGAVRSARGARTQRIAVICARGVRSRRVTAQLTDAGRPIIDVSEGMLGSFSGPGWLRRGLPVQTWTGSLGG